MDNNQIIVQLAANLAEATARNTASFVSNKIIAIKAKKNDKDTINELEEIISELLTDKLEIQRIAQSYEQELVSQKITEKDIKYITDNLLPILSKFIPADKYSDLEQIKSILSIETLTIMQLLGFNYKKAIGEPLTNLLKKVIEAKIPTDIEANTKYALALTIIAQDKDATDRYFKLTGQNQ
jgi:hypothetical protein